MNNKILSAFFEYGLNNIDYLCLSVE